MTVFLWSIGVLYLLDTLLKLWRLGTGEVEEPKTCGGTAVEVLLNGAVLGWIIYLLATTTFLCS